MSSEPLDRPAQRFAVSHLNEADFKVGGLRSYSAYRDLGIAAATKGFATGHVIRMTAPFTEEQRQKHHHNVESEGVQFPAPWGGGICSTEKRNGIAIHCRNYLE
jgi:hypothetical protein